MRIILSGSIGRSVTGGQAWVNLQYLLGLSALGHDVYYLEDCGRWSSAYNWDTGVEEWGLDYPASFVHSCLEPFGFGNRWIYRAGEETRGGSLEAFLELCSTADLLLIRGVPLLEWRSEYDQPKRRAFIDVDPGFTQMRFAQGEAHFVETLSRCETLFTYAQRLGAKDCPIPDLGREWVPTLPPICLDHWPLPGGEGLPEFTSIVRWRGFTDVVFEGVLYGQRDRELPRFIDLPRLTGQPFRLALTGGLPQLFADRGWLVEPGWLATRTPVAYQQLIALSRAEFGVAKHGYVATRGGWFSDRSVCYLASGRPVLVQETGQSEWLATGNGVVTFSTLEQAAEGVQRINSDYDVHRQAARRLAETVFAADRVLEPLVRNATGQ